MKLGLTAPLGEAETPASFISRVAASNGLKAAEFCLDWDLRFQSIVDGNEDAISAVAAMSGADAGALLRDAFVRLAPLMYEYRGQKADPGRAAPRQGIHLPGLRVGMTSHAFRK